MACRRHNRPAGRSFVDDVQRCLLPHRCGSAEQGRPTLLTRTDSQSGYVFFVANKIWEMTMSQELVFYTHPQSRGGIVHWMLEEIGHPYELRTLDSASTMKAPDYLAINPMGKVPAIRHGDAVVTEAAAICAYLADAFSEAGLAPAPEDRASYYRWLFFAAACCEPAMSNHATGWDPATPDLQRSFGYGSFEKTFEVLAEWLRGRSFVAGNRFSAADVYVASLLNYGKMFDIIPRKSEFEAYAAPLLRRPAKQRADEQIQALMMQDA
jgi:glutathione S-transferase